MSTQIHRSASEMMLSWRAFKEFPQKDENSGSDLRISALTDIPAFHSPAAGVFRALYGAAFIPAKQASAMFGVSTNSMSATITSTGTPTAAMARRPLAAPFTSTDSTPGTGSLTTCWAIQREIG